MTALTQPEDIADILQRHQNAIDEIVRTLDTIDVPVRFTIETLPQRNGYAAMISAAPAVASL